ncbi:MAG: carbohydrate ABC transporter permease [Chloroflexi bacterium]|nr:carbohydrate ABC transporter permease [Chloroflexota bacterium]
MFGKRNLGRKASQRIAHGFTYLVMGVTLLITIYPVLWMIFGSLKSDSEFYTNIWGFPEMPVWQNYVVAWTQGGLGIKFINSAIATIGTLAIVLPFTSLAAYAFAKLKFPGSTALFYFFLLSLMIPHGVIAIPVFSVVIKLGLLNTRLSLILVYSAQALGFGIFLLRAFFISLPRELEEAALLDGCTPIGAFFRVILPLAKPGLATQVIFSGMSAWNEYFMSSILVRSTDLMTLPLGMVNFVGQRITYYPQLFAMLAIVTLPIVVVYILGQKQFISGMTAGALKG